MKMGKRVFFRNEDDPLHGLQVINVAANSALFCTITDSSPSLARLSGPFLPHPSME